MMYFGEQPGEDKCLKCGGLHTRPCRENERAQVIQPVFARYRQRTENWIRKKEEEQREAETEEETESETEQEPEPTLQPEQQEQQHHQQEDRQEPPPPYWHQYEPKPKRQEEPRRPLYQKDTNRTTQHYRYPPQNQDRRYQPRFNAHPNYYGNNRLFNPHSRNEGRGDTRLREDWQGNGPERRREGGYTYDNRRERTQEDQYSRDQPRSQARNPQAQERRQQEGITYQRNQQPVDGTLGNTGAQTPPTTAFRIDNKRYNQDRFYESDKYRFNPPEYNSDFYHSNDNYYRD
jgi:hypothetical protein